MSRRVWETELSCFGYHGFGGGYAAIAEGKATPGHGLYCNVCPQAQGCWEEHQRRAREIFPDLTAELDAMLAKHAGQARLAAREFWERFQVAPPDLAIQGGNIEDGMTVAAGGQPHDRGRGTLAWPLVRRGKVA